MSPFIVAAVWAFAGIAAGALLPALRLRRLGVLVPLAGLAVLFFVAPSQTPVPGSEVAGEIGLDRVALGLMAAAAASLAATLLLSPTVEPAQLRTMGLAGAAVVIALGTGSAIVWAVAFVGGLSVLALRWIASAPGRATFASGRAAVPGAAALLGAAPFLPVSDVLTGPRPVLVSGLLACGLAALTGLLPLGGWAVGALTSVPAVDSAVWAALVAPAALLAALRLESQLPPLALVYFEGILTVLGLATALWQGINAQRTAGRGRYARILLADLGLAAAAAGTGREGLALSALLLLTMTHLSAAPLLLQDAEVRPRARRVAWLLVCGLPPAPSFWGRLAVVEALSASSFWGMAAALAVLAMLFVSALLAALREREALPAAETMWQLRVFSRDSLAWCVVAGGVAAGVAPGAALSLVFGVH